MGRVSKWKGELLRDTHWDNLIDDYTSLTENVSKGYAPFEKLANYIIRKNGSYYEAINGSTGKIDYGGSGNAGGIDGTSITAVTQAVIDALPSNGGTITYKNATYDFNEQGVDIPPSGAGTDWVLKVIGESKEATILKNSSTTDPIFKSGNTSWSWFQQVIFENIKFEASANAGGLLSLDYLNMALRDVTLEGGDLAATAVYGGGSGAPHVPSIIDNVQTRLSGDQKIFNLWYEGLVINSVGCTIENDRSTNAYFTFNGTQVRIGKINFYVHDSVTGVGDLIDVLGTSLTMNADTIMLVPISSTTTGNLFGDINAGSRLFVKEVFIDASTTAIGVAKNDSTLEQLYIDYLNKKPYRVQTGRITGIPIDSLHETSYTADFPNPWLSYGSKIQIPSISLAWRKETAVMDWEGWVRISAISSTQLTVRVKITTASGTAGATVGVDWIATLGIRSDVDKIEVAVP